MNDNFPKIKWIKNEPIKYDNHFDGSEYLLSVEVYNNGLNPKYEIYHVIVHDGEMFVKECGCPFDGFVWSDIEYFALLSGEMPIQDCDVD